MIGLVIVPDGAPIPIHAGFTGFDSFAPRTKGLVTLTLLPLLVTGLLFLGYWSRQDSSSARAVVAIVGSSAMVVLLIFNIQAVRYGMRFDS
ncbi:MAG: hypothetical protein M3290_10240 [Actinomycetota bacterium]|nr:hypothetical protein [Actinomycetota bacterium]